MTDPVLTDLPIRHMEVLFSPPGLPLPIKGESEVGTTSILVRGGPGAGKTTLAVGLAHGIAKHGGGTVLYLTTEFSPVEVAFKAKLYGLKEDAVDVWPGEKPKAGDLLVHHLVESRPGHPVASSAERRRTSMDTVWGLLQPEKVSRGIGAVPVRVVVIDALTLPDPGESEGALRADLVAFVQGLENSGISVVLVEELGERSFAWSAFVVDVVFDLTLAPDSETQELRRKLTLPKCRYAVTIPGPHDYGLEAVHPAVWPDIFRTQALEIGRYEGEGHSPARHPPTAHVPFAGSWVELRNHVVLSFYDVTSTRAISVLRAVPGYKWVEIFCGPKTEILFGDTTATKFEHEGVASLAWAVLEMAAANQANACLFQGLEAFLSNPARSTAVLRLLDALRTSGLLVFVHTSSMGGTRLLDIADLEWSGKKRVPQQLPRRLHRSHLCSLVLSTGFEGQVRASLNALLRGSDLASFPALSESLFTVIAQNLREPVRWALRRYRGEWLGSVSFVSGNLAEPGDPRVFQLWLALAFGQDLDVANDVTQFLPSFETPPVEARLLWAAVCAAVSLNAAAMDVLKEQLGTANELRIIDPLLRGLVGTGLLDEADQVVTDLATRHPHILAWEIERVRADMRLDSSDPEVWKDAAQRLQELAERSGIPVLAHAETWFNIGVARDRLGAKGDADMAFAKALEINPILREVVEKSRV